MMNPITEWRRANALNLQARTKMAEARRAACRRESAFATILYDEARALYEQESEIWGRLCVNVWWIVGALAILWTVLLLEVALR